jgi:hypothetical protein
MGCRIQGNGPVLVTKITDGAIVRNVPSSLLQQEGEAFKIDALCSQGIHPMIGDVLTMVNDTSVLHLTSQQLQRFLLRTVQEKEKEKQRTSRAASGISDRDIFSNSRKGSVESARMSRRNSQATSYGLTICFRRYYVDDAADVVKGDVYYKNMTEAMQSLKVSLTLIYYVIIGVCAYMKYCNCIVLFCFVCFNHPMASDILISTG